MHHHFDHRGRGDGMHCSPGQRGGRFGGRGFGRGFGGFGDDMRVGRLLGGGDLRLVVLLLLSQEARHGYDLIKAIEERSSGAYSPSPGVIYPALTFLEEAGYAESRAEGNKKVYQTTDAGELHLAENRSEADAVAAGLEHIGKRAEFMRARLKEHDARREARHDRDLPGVIDDVNTARKRLKRAIATAIGGDEEAQHRLAHILDRAAEAIEKGEVDI